MTRHSDQTRVWDLIDSLKFAMLVTHDSEGDALRARPMHAHGERAEEGVAERDPRAARQPVLERDHGGLQPETGRQAADERDALEDLTCDATTQPEEARCPTFAGRRGHDGARYSANVENMILL